VSANRGLKDSRPAYLEGETLHGHSGARAVPFTTTDAYTRHLVFRACQSSPRIDVSLKGSITTCDGIGACSVQLRKRLVARNNDGTIRTLPRTLDQRSRGGRRHPVILAWTRLLLLGVLIAPEIGGFVLVTPLTVRNESDRHPRL
jgi:hypothetical protein